VKNKKFFFFHNEIGIEKKLFFTCPNWTLGGLVYRKTDKKKIICFIQQSRQSETNKVQKKKGVSGLGRKKKESYKKVKKKS
jgi:hypothetical protein